MSTRAREIAELGQKLTVDGSGNLDIAGSGTFDGLTVDGVVTLDTDSGSQPLQITRQGATDQQVKIWVDDDTANYQAIQDEATGARHSFRHTNGSVTNVETLLLSPDYGAVFNQAGLAAHDFRVESDTNTHMLFVDASENSVGIGLSNPTAAGLEIRTEVNNTYSDTIPYQTHTGDSLVIYNNPSDSSDDYVAINMLSRGAQTSAMRQILKSGGGGDGTYFWQFRDSADTSNTVKRMSYTSEGDQKYYPLTNTSTVFNEDGVDHDFRVESDGASHMLFVDASANRIGIGEASPGAPLHLSTSSVGQAVIIESTDPSASAGPDISLFRSSSSPADNDTMGRIRFRGKNVPQQNVDYGIISSIVQDVTDGTEDSYLKFDTMRAGVQDARFHIYGSEVVVNEIGHNGLDFRAESDNSSHMLFVDASADAVGINTSAPAATLHVRGRSNTTNGDAVIRLDEYNYSHAGADVVGGGIDWYGGDASSPGYDTRRAFIRTKSDDEYNRVGLSFGTGTTGAVAEERFRLTAQGGAYFYPRDAAGYPNSFVWNEDGGDADFRVASDNETHALFVEAGEDRVGINHSNPSYTLHVGDTNTENMGIGWMRMETFAVDIHDADTRWYKLANYTTNILQGQLFMISSRGGGANQTNGGRIQHGTISGYNNTVQNRWGDLGTNYGHTAYYVEVGTDNHVYLRVNNSIYGGSVFCTFQGRGNWVFDGTYVTSAP